MWRGSPKSWPAHSKASFAGNPSSGTSISPTGPAIAREEVREVKIAMLSPYSLSRPGGVQGQVFGLSRALRKLGHDVTVLGPDNAEEADDEGASVVPDP